MDQSNNPDYIPPGSTIPELSGRHPAPYELMEKAGSHELSGEFGQEKVEHVKAIDEAAGKTSSPEAAGKTSSPEEPAQARPE